MAVCETGGSNNLVIANEVPVKVTVFLCLFDRVYKGDVVY